MSLVSEDWMARFPHGSSYNTFVPVSNHSSIVLQIEEQVSLNSCQGFMFENKWFQELGLREVIEKCWLGF